MCDCIYIYIKLLLTHSRREDGPQTVMVLDRVRAVRTHVRRVHPSDDNRDAVKSLGHCKYDYRSSLENTPTYRANNECNRITGFNTVLCS